MPEQWLTYAAAGRLLGTSVEAARQRARRLGWRTQPGNDGRTLVLVPDQPDVHPVGQPPVHPYIAPSASPTEMEALRELATAMREQLAKAETQAERERQDRQAERERHAEESRAERERLEQARAALAVERERWEARLDSLANDLAEERKTRVLAALEEVRVRAELERLRSRPWWRRLLGAG
jgi:hypothetical protein